MVFAGSPPLRYNNPLRSRTSMSDAPDASGPVHGKPLSLSQRLQNLVPDLIEDTMLIADAQTYDVLWVNKAGGKQFPDWPTRKCHQLFEAHETPCPACPVNSLEDDQPFVREMLSSDKLKYMRCTTRVFRHDGRKFIFETVQNIDHAKRREQRREQELQQQREVSAIFSDSMTLLSQNESDFATTVHTILDKLGNTYNARRVQVLELYTDPSGKMLADCTFEWVAPTMEEHRSQLQKISVEILAPWIEFFRDNDTLYVENIDDLPSGVEDGGMLRDLLKKLDVQSMILQSFLCDDKIAGFVAVDSPRRYHNEYSLARTLGAAIAQEKNRREQIHELTNMGTIDQLSGLQNRNRFNQVKEHLVEHLPRTLGIAFMDLNNLKLINDTEGHEQGDVYIRAMSECFVRHFRHAEVFRVGGDEFVILASNMGHDLFMRRLKAMQEDADNKYADSLALGYVWTDDPSGLDDLITQADNAMYENKRKMKEKLGQEVR